MQKVILKIGGMSCSACSVSLEKYLRKQKGIEEANVNLVLAQAFITYDDKLTIKDLEKFIKEAGFESLGIEKNDQETSSNKKDFLLLFFFLTLIILYIAMAPMFKLPMIKELDKEKNPVNYALSLLILVLPFLIYGKDIIKSGIKNFIHKTPNMDSLVTLGVTTSFLYSIFGLINILAGNLSYRNVLYFESCAVIIFFVKLGRKIEGKNQEKTKEALKELVQITPTKALKKEGKIEKEVTIDEVREYDILICKPGMKVAVDGKIVKGTSHLEEAFITGESLPIKKTIGDTIVAGSINLDGYIEYEALKIGKNSTISEIVRLVVEAANNKSPIQKIADKVCGYFVPTILLIALGTFLGYVLMGLKISQAVIAFVTVLVVACPCALGLATPLCMIISLGRCAQNGILIRTSEILETASKMDTIVFDKTGTLTYGKLKIAKIINYSTEKDKELLKKVASIEQKSTHPIAKAFLLYAKENKLKLTEVEGFKEIAGIGVSAKENGKKITIGNQKLLKNKKLKQKYQKDEQRLTSLGNSIVYVMEDKEVIALIGVKDIVREEAPTTIKKLEKLGKEIIMLTGDNEKTAAIIAKTIGIKKVISNLLPSEKTEVIKNLQREGKEVMMVGDGINDAPSLAVANIGISMNSGTDIAASTSDVILVNDKLDSIEKLLTISKNTQKIVYENLFWAFFYNLCMIPLAMGLLKPYFSMNPMMASFAMMLSSITVVLNSLRLREKINRG